MITIAWGLHSLCLVELVEGRFQERKDLYPLIGRSILHPRTRDYVVDHEWIDSSHSLPLLYAKVHNEFATGF